jgi:NAD(P)-dependent dehydrogenase (short-subunit alcohol dehydrogenase family)
MTAELNGRTALVTGASRGVGKGVALGLGEAGATVYVTGRTVTPGAGPMGLPGTIGETADEISRLGGTGVAVRCDHTDDGQVEAVFERIDRERGGLDLLVNSVWGGYERMFENNEYTWPSPSGSSPPGGGTRCSRRECAPTTWPGRWPPAAWSRAGRA